MTLILDKSQIKYRELEAVLLEQEGDYTSVLNFYTEYASELNQQEKAKTKLCSILTKKA
jgi:hypothetical protein